MVGRIVYASFGECVFTSIGPLPLSFLGFLDIWAWAAATAVEENFLEYHPLLDNCELVGGL